MSVFSLLFMNEYDNALDDEFIYDSSIAVLPSYSRIDSSLPQSPIQYNKPSKSNASYWSGKVSSYTPNVGNGMCFTVDDFLSAGREKYTRSTIDPAALNNATQLINKINELGTLIDYHNVISSGYRSPERQRQIYAEKGEKPAMGSKHLYGHALDIYDPKGELKEKLLNKVVLEKMKELDLYVENFNMTPNWVHFQDQKPATVGRQIWSADTLLQRV